MFSFKALQSNDKNLKVPVRNNRYIYKTKIKTIMSLKPLLDCISKLVAKPENENDIRLLEQAFKTAYFTKGTFLEKENSIAQNLYFISKGYIRTYYYEEGNEITTQILGKNNFITSFESFVTHSISIENIQCVTDCEVLYITKSDYTMLNNESTFWSAFCKQLYEKTITFHRQRINDLLTLTAEKRYLKLLDKQPEVIQNVPIQYVASYIGVKPESLSRIRKKIIS
ncbi:Crp/Fnr family transcriptional regulator [Flavobacterium sp. H122]|uniref:Crp/Fnr family transcriptional regulator n=1 Tax=Flavobacterium sp. H122 TaxID=2529860 RepID=UPI0010AB130E|nr:Crp/Fnr family transcriptional regulator [Flavobacterium sp. H122]